MNPGAVALHPLTWAALWIAVYALASIVQASLHERAPGNAFEAWVWRTMHDPPRAMVLRTAYLVAPLVLASLLRIAEPAELGLVAPAGQRAVLLAAGLACAVVAALVGGGRRYARLSEGAPPPGAQPDRRVAATVALEGVSLEAYWAFVRGAVLSVGLGNTTLAVFLALGLLALQSWTNPARRADFLEPDEAAGLGHGAGLALLSAAAFLAAGSLVVCVLVHWGAALALEALGMGATSRPQRELEAPPPAQLTAEALPEPTVV